MLAEHPRTKKKIRLFQKNTQLAQNNLWCTQVRAQARFLEITRAIIKEEITVADDIAK